VKNDKTLKNIYFRVLRRKIKYLLKRTKIREIGFYKQNPKPAKIAV